MSGMLEWDDPIDMGPPTEAADPGPSAPDPRRERSHASYAREANRKHPIRLFVSVLSGTWYLVTRYQDLGDGHFIAEVKQEVLPEDRAYIEAIVLTEAKRREPLPRPSPTRSRDGSR